MLTGPRKTQQKMGDDEAFGVAAGAVIYQGALVVLDGGWAEGGASGAGLVSVGVALSTVDNSSGSNGDAAVQIRKGIWKFDNDGTDPVTISDIGSDCFVVDDHTVAKTDDTGARSVAGKITNLDAGGVWVKF